MERTTQLYNEMQVCEVFGKWYHEFVSLPDDEQYQHMQYVMLKNAKTAYANKLEKERPQFFSWWWGLGG
jgi:hypothetical protein